MGKLTILYDDQAVDAVLSGGSWLTELPLSNLQTEDISEVARTDNTSSLVTTFMYADFAAVATPVIDGVVLGPTNVSRSGVSPAAMWQVVAWDTNAMGSVIYDSNLLPIPNIVDDRLPLYLHHIFPSTISTAKFYGIFVVDNDNTDGFIEAGRLLLPKKWTPDVNYGEDNNFSFEPLVDTQETFNGRRFFLRRGLRRRFTCSLPFLTTDEIFDDVLGISLAAGISEQVFVIPDNSDLTYGPRRNFLATMMQAPAIRQLLVDLGSTAFNFEEVL